MNFWYFKRYICCTRSLSVAFDHFKVFSAFICTVCWNRSYFLYWVSLHISPLWFTLLLKHALWQKEESTEKSLLGCCTSRYSRKHHVVMGRKKKIAEASYRLLFVTLVMTRFLANCSWKFSVLTNVALSSNLKTNKTGNDLIKPNVIWSLSFSHPVVKVVLIYISNWLLEKYFWCY